MNLDLGAKLWPFHKTSGLILDNVSPKLDKVCF